MKSNEELDEDGFPPVKEGYHRVFMDHTGRWYKDFSAEEWEAHINDPLIKIWREAVTNAIDLEIIANLYPRGN